MCRPVSYTHLDVYKRQGHDDAIALLLALGSPEVELKAVTTTAGNNVVDKTFHNTLKVLSPICLLYTSRCV